MSIHAELVRNYEAQGANSEAREAGEAFITVERRLAKDHRAWGRGYQIIAPIAAALGLATGDPELAVSAIDPLTRGTKWEREGTITEGIVTGSASKDDIKRYGSQLLAMNVIRGSLVGLGAAIIAGSAPVIAILAGGYAAFRIAAGISQKAHLDYYADSLDSRVPVQPDSIFLKNSVLREAMKLGIGSDVALRYLEAILLGIESVAIIGTAPLLAAINAVIAVVFASHAYSGMSGQYRFTKALGKTVGDRLPAPNRAPSNPVPAPAPD